MARGDSVKMCRGK